MKGAVHGDATITDKAPVIIELIGPEPLANFSNLPRLLPIFKSVIRYTPIAKMSPAKIVTTNGLCNWYPHPISSPAFFNVTRVKAMIIKVITTPTT